MNIKKLERATKILEQIKQLDKEIIEIDRIAMLVANGEIKSSFNLNIEDLNDKHKEESKVEFDEYGSLTKKSESMFSFIIQPMWSCDKKEYKKEYLHTLTADLTDTCTLQILGVLLLDKQTKRNVLIDKIKKQGVSI